MGGEYLLGFFKTSSYFLALKCSFLLKINYFCPYFYQSVFIDMKHLFKILAIILLLPIFHANAQTDTAFWFCVPQLTKQHQDDHPKLFITATPDADAHVKIEMPRESGFTTVTHTVPKGKQWHYDFYDSYFSNGRQDDNIIESGLCDESCQILNKGIHIVSDNPVTAYLQRGDTKNCDIWALKGKNALNGANGKVKPKDDFFIVPVEDIGNAEKNVNSGMDRDFDCSKNKPGAWYAVDIVAVQDCKVTVTLPTDDNGNITLEIENWNSNEPSRTFSMKRGQTLNLQAKSQNKDEKSSGGIIVKATGKITVQWKDDSLYAGYVNEPWGGEGGGKGTSWDAAGDQLVPVSLADTGYIVMRGQLASSGSNKMYENVYFMSTTDGETTIEFKTDAKDGNNNPVVIPNQTLSGIGSWGKLLLNSKQMGVGEKINYDAVYIKSDKPIIVWHISGSAGAELGGAILPTIEGCTGSEDVTVCRSSTEAFGFWLNIMCKKAHIKDFVVTVKGTEYKLKESWFKEIPGTGWYYLDRGHMKFGEETKNDNNNYSNDGIPAVGYGETDGVISVKNTSGLFHLAVINGDKNGSCQYGYFSDFSSNTGRAVIQSAGFQSGYTKFCVGDTVELKASGGLSYSWKFINYDENDNEIESEETFIDDNQLKLANPKVTPYVDFNQYQVTIQRRCYLSNNPDTVIDVYARGFPRTESKFEIKQLDDCSPTRVVVKNTTEEGDYIFDYTWTLGGGELSNPLKSESKNPEFKYGKDTLTFINTSDDKYTYTLNLRTHLGENCPDKGKSTDFSVNPVIKADMYATPVRGCAPLNVTFTNNSFGPYTRIVVDFGDGHFIEHGSTVYPKPIDDEYKDYEFPVHTYYNTNDKDTTYHAKVTVYDDKNGSCESEFTVDITVLGRVKSQYIIDNTSGCAPFGTRIQNVSLGDQDWITYTWEITGRPDTVKNGDGSHYTIKNNSIEEDFANGLHAYTLTYNNNGTEQQQYQVRLIAVRQYRTLGEVCKDTSSWETITVFPEFHVDYTVSPLFVCDSSDVSFVNNSTDLTPETNFRWIFGDGATDNTHEKLFDHTYYHTLPDEQDYETQLIGESKFGCRDSADITVTVMPYLNPHFTIDKVEGCSPFTVTVENNTPGHAYKSEDPLKINCPQGVTYYVMEGTLNGLGTTKIKFINQTGSKKEVEITLTDKYRNPNMTYDCRSNPYSRTITVYPEIEAKITSDKTAPVCDGTTVTFTNSTIFSGVTTSPADYRWTFGDGATLNKTDNSDTEHPYYNTTGSTGTTPLSFTATLIAMAYGCSDTATATVEVYPPVTAAFSSDNYSVCDSTIVTLENSSAGAGKFVYRFIQDDPAADTERNNMSAVTYTFVNTDPNQMAVRPVTLMAYNGECGDTITKNYYVYPEIVPQFSLSKTEGCAPVQDVVLDRSATTGASIYKVDFGDGITDETGRAQLTHTFENKTGADASYVVKLTAANIIGCQAETTDTVTVYPEIKAAFSFEKASDCSPIDVKMINNSLNGSKFTWTFDDGTANEVKTTKDDFNHRYSHKDADGNNISTYNIKLVVVDANHTVCRDSVSRKIQIYPQVIAAFETKDDVGCSPLTTTFTNKSKGYGLTYSWDYDHDNTHSAESAVSHTHTFDNIESATHTYNVKLTVTDINNCQSVATMSVKAYPHVTADFAYVKNQTCTPYPVTFSYPTSALNGNRFDWDFGFGDNKATKTDRQTFDFVFDNDALDEVRTYTITLVTTDTTFGCSDRTSKPIEVYPQLKPAFTQDITEGCNPLPVAFTNQTTGLADYLWEFGDSQSSSEVNPKHLFKHYELTDQNYNVVLKTTQTATGCEKKVNQNITVYSYVHAKFGINETEDGANGAANGILGGCTPFDVTITDSSRLISTGTWSWDFGDGTTSTKPQPQSRIYTNDDRVYPLENKSYTIKLVVTNDHGCKHDTAQVVAVYPRSVPDFTGNFVGCEPLTVAFEDKSVVDDKTQYFWTFSDGSTIVDKPPFSKTFHNYDYENSKKYTVNLKTTTEYNCADDITKEIEVYAKPLARFIPLADRACPPFEAEFKNSSIGTGLSFNWNFGNGEVRDTTGLGNQKVVYNNTTSEPITYNVVLMTESDHGCRDTMINPMITFPDVVVDFDYNPAGCSPHTVNFVNKSSKTVTNHLWYFGEGSASVADAPTFTYFNTTDNDQVMTVTYIGSSKYQCTDTIKKDVTVYINPNVDFVAHEPSQRYPDDTVYFENYTQDGPWTYSWDFGDGKTSKTSEKYFMHKYGTWAPNSNDNIFHVTLSVQSEHCKNTVSHDVTILPPYPRIRITNEKPAGCVPLTVQFAIEAEYCKTYEWTFDDGSTSTEPTPEHTFTEPGIYNVKLTAYGDGGSHYDYEIITVHELPQPDFTTSPQFVMLPNQQVQFFNATRNGYNYVWDFGDGTYSSEQNPHHLYTEEGIYDVKLVAYSTQMCVDSILKIAEVEVSGAGYIKYPNAFMPSDMSPSDGSYPVPDDMNNVFHPKWSGVKEYDLWIFNRWGEMLFHTTNIEVGWNGKYNNDGKDLGQDVYFWKAKGKFQNNTPFKIAGDVTLIRK